MAGTGGSAKSLLKRDWPREGRMWSIGPDSSGAGSVDARTESSSVADIAYDRLRADMLVGALPPGMNLKLEGLRARYDVSINTLRETLSLLAADGLVEAEGQRGFPGMPAPLR